MSPHADKHRNNNHWATDYSNVHVQAESVPRHLGLESWQHRHTSAWMSRSMGGWPCSLGLWRSNISLRFVICGRLRSWKDCEYCRREAWRSLAGLGPNISGEQLSSLLCSSNINHRPSGIPVAGKWVTVGQKQQIVCVCVCVFVCVSVEGGGGDSQINQCFREQIRFLRWTFQ